MAFASTFLPSFAEVKKEFRTTFSCANEQPSQCVLDRTYLSASKRSLSRIVFQSRDQNEENSSKKKVANLHVQQNQIIPIPTYSSSSGVARPLSKFLSQKAGMESVLNINALQSHEYIGSNIFRCTLPKLEILSFEVAPIVDLSVIATEQECIVEMLSCKFQGSDLVESQNERFSASMRNHLSWNNYNGNEQMLEVNVQLKVSLEVYTLPFTLLPLSAVETPGNAILQAMVDRMVPIFLEQLLNDYSKWSQDMIEESETPAEEFS